MAQGVEICAVSWHIIPKMKIKNQKYVGIYAHVGVYGSTGDAHKHQHPCSLSFVSVVSYLLASFTNCNLNQQFTQLPSLPGFSVLESGRDYTSPTSWYLQPVYTLYTLLPLGVIACESEPLFSRARKVFLPHFPLCEVNVFFFFRTPRMCNFLRCIEDESSRKRYVKIYIFCERTDERDEDLGRVSTNSILRVKYI